MANNIMKTKWLTIPNIFSYIRICSVPFLFYLAWKDYPNLFLIVLAFALSTDALDGYFARKLNQITTLGTTLDSIGDMAMYMTIPPCAWLLWPELIRQDIIYIIIAILAFVIPIVGGFIKFGRMPSYHTWLAKLTTVLLSFTALIWFATEIVWPFKISVFIQVIVMMEYLAITVHLNKWRGNIPTYWHAIGKFPKNK
jgi:CDP-diacylglycerol--glycerol-3-phosphate 3-phosphatidyltransferase